jgi:hypothetical protein
VAITIFVTAKKRIANVAAAKSTANEKVMLYKYRLSFEINI